MKNFGSLLKDHPDVLKQSQLYPKANIKMWEDIGKVILPETFDGRDVWESYIQFPYDQENSESWAVVSSNILADRYTISTVGQINLFLSSTEIISCIDKPPNRYIKNVLSGLNLDYKDSTQGYSIYDGWEYIYENGVSEKNCFSKKKLIQRNIPLPFKLSFKEKIEVYGHKCSKIEENQLYCVVEKDKPIARRTFFSNSIFNIIEDTLEDTIKSIKYELLRFGPVAAGFIVYDNFVNEYDGKSVYDQVKGEPLGGHYVSIVGWEKDSWICRNNWGVNWGLLGFFKMKMGIRECMLESNISACSPYYHSLDKDQYFVDGFYKGENVDISDMKLFNPELFKNQMTFDIDKTNFYPKKAIKLIKEGKIYGDLDPIIMFPNELPNLHYYWAKDFKNFKFITEKFDREKHKSKSYFYYYLLFIIFFIIGIYK